MIQTDRSYGAKRVNVPEPCSGDLIVEKMSQLVPEPRSGVLLFFLAIW